MKKHYFWAFMLVVPAAIVSCSDIDLNDVDMNVEVPVKDMTIPLNLSKMTLGSMLDVDNDGKLREINGDYAVVVEGSYKSDKIHVPAFTAKAEDIADISGKIAKTKPGAKSAKRTRRAVDYSNPKVVAEYLLPQTKEILKAHASEIDEAIQKLREVKVNTTFHFTLDIDKTGKILEKVKAIHVEDFCVQLPRGIVGSISIMNGDGRTVVADYSSETGLVSFVGKNIYTTTGKLEIVGEVTGFNADLLEEAFHSVESSNGRAGRAANSGELNINEKVGVESGKAVVYDTDFRDSNLSENEMFDSLPDVLAYQSQGAMEDVKVTEVSGSFAYKVDDFRLDDVSLGDIPEVLQQSGTSLHLDNPQVYVDLHNPVVDGAGKPISVSTDLAIEAKSKSGKVHEYNLEGKVEANTTDYFFYLSPKAVDEKEKYEGFEGAKHIQFEALADVFSCIDDAGSAATIDEAAGEGLPESISISATNTQVFGENVKDFPLDKDYFIDGHYAFVAPLALSENSRIKYTEVADGWHDDVEGLVITKLVLSANVTTDVPFELQFRVTPIDVRGERIEGEYTTLVIPANAQNAPIELVIKGDIHNLDGVKFDALALSKDARTLQPGLNISISDLKVKVSGKYEAEL